MRCKNLESRKLRYQMSLHILLHYQKSFPISQPCPWFRKLKKSSLTVPKTIIPYFYTLKRTIAFAYTLPKAIAYPNACMPYLNTCITYLNTLIRLPILIHALPILKHWRGFWLSAPYLNACIAYFNTCITYLHTCITYLNTLTRLSALGSIS